jgi:hypothetical protein
MRRIRRRLKRITESDRERDRRLRRERLEAKARRRAILMEGGRGNGQR